MTKFVCYSEVPVVVRRVSRDHQSMSAGNVTNCVANRSGPFATHWISRDPIHNHSFGRYLWVPHARRGVAVREVKSSDWFEAFEMQIVAIRCLRRTELACPGPPTVVDCSEDIVLGERVFEAPVNQEPSIWLPGPTKIGNVVDGEPEGVNN